ncbi:cytidylate kinase [Parabacteroides sp. PF5-5]|uniref:(d)CMP kinase n=1 Tax=unclassified Parabacteroides TaxID=2649774 RepID=UPI0024757704|nr:MULTISPECIES: (d)CMP kinase [unclassified Parabacteroides]MDH6303469.1 cytidylate kinase [Parabacteroides sp. PH5-39]MDH6314791.1 cytidylate kinase [Parabacteroides sp. PF5-13]MDH6318128.1 cytidylate kinase [Parabacteroides sp. PH5-13]MDH6321940.1 cytidylate kinase [Parabacteroides sp. PH5-8]MDH6326064.1 cytidylate kinase [Parabacteroides sp. PH5-41]
MKRITIAIDGFSSSGKSTMAKDLAKEIGYVYIDSGAMYRAVTLYCLLHGIISNGQINEEQLMAVLPDIDISFRLNEQTGRPDTYLDGVCVEKEIRTMQVSDLVSPVAALPFVREALVAKQQLMGQQKGVVMDGRDVGTVVFPDAELKIFVTASPEVRAQRRVDELLAKGEPVSFEEVLENVKSRDHIDSTRAVGPLKQAEDALVLDNSYMSIAEQKAWLLTQYKRVVGE